jgi:hypothetical protein
MNLNELAKAICKEEGGAVNLSIAQVKQVLRCLGGLLRGMDTEAAFKLVQRLMK